MDLSDGNPVVSALVLLVYVALFALLTYYFGWAGVFAMVIITFGIAFWMLKKNWWLVLFMRDFWQGIADGKKKDKKR
jgi:hypothetical protein